MMNKLTIPFFFSIILMIVLVQYFRSNHTIQSQTRHFIGNEASDILINAEILSFYRLGRRTSEANAFNGFEVKEQCQLTNPVAINALKQFLGKDNNYGYDYLIKNCIFTPQYGFSFVHKNKKIAILISIDCTTIRFIGDTWQKEEDLILSSDSLKSQIELIRRNDF